MSSTLQPDDKTFVGMIRRHPIGQNISADEIRKTTIERQRLVDSIRAIEEAAPKEYAHHERLVKVAKAKLAAAELVWCEARDAYNSAIAAESSASFRRTDERARIEAQLRQTADNDVVDAFSRRVVDEEERLRKFSFHVNEVIATALMLLPGRVDGRPRKFLTNRRSWNRRRLATIALRDEIESFRYIADQTDLAARLQSRFDELPPIVDEQLTEAELEEIRR